jgi:hypothetical protein
MGFTAFYPSYKTESSKTKQNYNIQRRMGRATRNPSTIAITDGHGKDAGHNQSAARPSIQTNNEHVIFTHQHDLQTIGTALLLPINPPLD